MLQNALLQNHHHWAIRSGMNVRAGLQALIFRKALRLSNAAKHSVSNGEIENMASNDAERVMMLYYFVTYTIAAPLQVVAVMILLYLQVQHAMWFAMVVPLLTFPLQRVFGNSLQAYNKDALKASDRRVNMVQELVNGIRLIKYYAWESWMQGRIVEAREEELNAKFWVSIVNSGNGVILEAAPIISTVAVFLAYTLLFEQELAPSNAFTTVALVGQLKLPFLVMPMLISAYISADVANKRLWRLMALPERTSYLSLTKPSPEAPALQLTDAVLHWEVPKHDQEEEPGTADEADEAQVSVQVQEDAKAPPGAGLDEEGEVELVSGFTLRNLNLQVAQGQLVTIVGQVGSGKSSLLRALLGDMALEGGKVGVLGVQGGDGLSAPPMLYCPQQPQIWNDTVRDNILFGQPMDQARYDEVVEGCQLLPDFRQFAAGDATEIGEKGVSLSGGQKARVALARVVYAALTARDTAGDAAPPPLVLLDDVLSAVDAHVGQRLFQDALCGLLAGTTRVFVSHQLQFLQESHNVVVMAGGAISHVGTFGEVKAQGSVEDNPLLAMLEDRAAADSTLRGDGAATAPEPAEATSEDAEARESEAGSASQAAAPSTTRSASVGGEGGATEKEEHDGTLVQDEERLTGAVSWSVYATYLTSMGLPTLSFIILGLLLSNGGQVATNWWLSAWSSRSFGGDQQFYLAVYSGVSLGSILLILVYRFAWGFGQIASGRALHNDMLSNIIRAPTAFFDATPAGRLHNRFSSDVNLVDTQVPLNFTQYMNSLVSIGSTLIVQVVVFPFVLIGFAPIGLVYVGLSLCYRHTNRELQRLDNISRSPIFNMLGETLTGTATLHAFQATERYRDAYETRVDTNNEAFWYKNLTNRWLGLRLDWLGSFMVGVTTFTAVATAGDVDPSLAALSITYALSVTGLLNWLVRSDTQTESFLSSVERMQHYSNVPSEAPAHIPETAPPAEWPQHGAISFKNYSMRYRAKAPLVLKGINLDIPAGAKVGVCGRTGAGKSSLMTALFRMTEPAAGSITIDGIDVSTLGLAELRSKMAIIPQDPVLFEGPLRYNLDPRGQHDDEALWAALDQASVGDTVRALSGGLSAPVSEGGSNFSVGQRQLLCMARAMLRDARIVVLDEATAAMDVSTDAALQRAIREVFKGTVLTIAHRLDTIADSDYILALDDGKVAEFGPPAELKSNSSGLYHALWKNAQSTGDQS